MAGKQCWEDREGFIGEPEGTSGVVEKCCGRFN